MGTRGKTWCCVVVTLAATAACGRRPDAQPMDASGSGVGDASVDASPPDALSFVCAPIPPPPTLPLPLPPAAGTRLVPRTIAEPVPGGLEVPWAVRDTLLGVDCEPAHYGDGTIRCLPALSALHNVPYQLFADAAHTIPVALEEVPTAPPEGTLAGTFTIRNGAPFDTVMPDCLVTTIQLWHTGAQRGETQYYDDLYGVRTVPPGFALYDLQPDTTTFVQLEEVRARLSDSIAIRELHGDDGSRLFSKGLYDTAHDVMIGFLDDREATAFLLPPVVERTNTHLVAQQPPSSDYCSNTDPIFIAQPPGTACDNSGLRFVTDRQLDRVFQVTKVAATTYGCEITELGPVLYEDHDPFLASCGTTAFEWGKATTVSTGARLTTRIWQIGDATFAPLTFRVFTDTALQVDCAPREASDGVVRCVPQQGAIVYADAACTAPVAVMFGSQPNAYASQGSLPSDVIGGQPPGQITVFLIGAARPVGPLYARTTEGCRAYDTVASFEVTELPASTFAAFEFRDVPASAAAAASAGSSRHPARR